MTEKKIIARKVEIDTGGRARYILTWLLIAALMIGFVFLIRSILAPFIIGLLSAYFLDPAADRLEKYGFRRTTATAIITAGFFAVMAVACALIVPLIVHQVMDFIDALPDYIARWQSHYGAYVNRFLSRVELGQGDAFKNAAGNVTDNILSVGSGVVAGVFRSSMTLLNILSLIFITPLVVFYLLRDWDRMTARLDAMLPRPHADTIREQVAAIDATLAGFIRGQLNVCFLLAVYYGMLLSIAGLSFGLVIGIFTGLLVVLPYVGFLGGFLTAAGVAYVQFGLTAPFFLVLGIYAVGQALESYFLTPKMVGDRVGLHPLWIIFGMLAGAAIFGFVGVLLAVPVTAVLGVLVRFAIGRYLDSSLYHGA